MPKFEIRKTNMFGKVLLRLRDGRIVVYCQGKLVVYNPNETVSMTLVLELSDWKKLLCKLRLTERAMHIDVRWAREVADGKIIFLLFDSVYCADLTERTILKEFSGFQGRPFSVTNDGEEYYMGDYGGNSNRNPVKIYKRDQQGNWTTAYSFPSNTIRHIHNIVKAEKGYYILSGDEDSESGIWFADEEFSSVCKVLVGSQQNRCCQLIIGSDCLWYLTDAPSEQNYLYRMGMDGKLQRGDSIDGTCIYGVEWNDDFVFSTTVEPEAHARCKLDYWLSNKPGKGIKNRNTSLMYFRDGKLMKVAEYTHDRKPLRLFQYATVYFAYGCIEQLYFTPYSVSRYDNHVLSMRTISE